MKKQIVIIGGGPGGYNAALQAARNGAAVTLIEKKKLGGVCLHLGCIPSKIMKTSADLLEKARKGKQFGLSGLENVSLDMAELMSRKKRIIQTQQKGLEQLISTTEIRLIKATAFIKNNQQLTVTLPDNQQEAVNFDKLIIATGSHPRNMAEFPFDDSLILSSNDILKISQPPSTLIIVGGGIIGCEFAFILNSYGTKVTVIESMDRLLPLPGIDPDISKILHRQMKKKGISVLLNTTVSKVEKNKNKITVFISRPPTNEKNQDKIRENHLSAEKALICVGRDPGTDKLGLDNAGVDTDQRGWIKVNKHLQTSNKNIYAIGDILGPEKSMLAHTAAKEGKIAAINSVKKNKTVMNYKAIPTIVYTNPEISCVGMSELEAAAAELETQTKTIQFRLISMAHIIGEIDGMAKIITEKDSGRILGVHIIGPHSPDIIGEGVLALKKNYTVQDLADTIHAHPTLGEILGETAANF